MSSSRSYRSDLRRDQAAATRGRVRGAARELFGELGFEATTIAAIAERAGVSVQTVYAGFGSKAGIVAQMMDELEDLADGRDAAEQYAAETDPVRRLALFVRFNRLLYERGAPVLRAVAAARNDPQIAAIAHLGNRRRLEAAEHLATDLADHEILAAEAGHVRAAARTLWLLTSAQQYTLAVDDLGWTPQEYERWLTSTLTRLLVTTSRSGAGRTQADDTPGTGTGPT